jgi:hypothetical protein
MLLPIDFFLEQIMTDKSINSREKVNSFVYQLDFKDKRDGRTKSLASVTKSTSDTHDLIYDTLEDND